MTLWRVNGPKIKKLNTFFLCIITQKLSNPKRNESNIAINLRNLRVFKTLSEYLRTRTPRQCRSHFQKLMNRFKNLKKMIDYHQNELGMTGFSEAHRV